VISPDEALDRLNGLVAQAVRQGASAADAILTADQSVSVSVRLGELEDLSRSEGYDLGLRVFKGRRQAQVSSSDWSKRGLEALVERVLAMADAAPEEPYAGLAPTDRLAKAPFPDCASYDATDPGEAALIQAAREAEAVARAAKGVTNSEGAGASASWSVIGLATSDGFGGAYRASGFGLSMTAVAGEGAGMERDYAYTSGRWYADLETPEEIGALAAKRAVSRLSPIRLDSGVMPILFDPRVANSLLGHFASAISGAAIARKTSFLLEKLGQLVFSPNVCILDDPLRPRGLRSKPFDAEGVSTAARALIDQGRLTTWLLDSASARQLGLEPTGHATRGVSGPPSASVSNLHMTPGAKTPEQLMASVGRAFYVTELIGMGVNGVTGDYSRGASGFLVEQGELTRPVSEVTIAGNLLDMFANLEPANDLEFRYGTNSPTLLIPEMTVAGQ
jgi:PmbA protein